MGGEASIPVAQHKTEGSATFIGIPVDTMQFQLQLPTKLAWLRVMVFQWLDCQSCTCCKLESLTGHLAHSATVICPGHMFLCPLFALITTPAKPHHFVHLNLSVWSDLLW